MSAALFTSLFVLVLCVLMLGLARAWGRYLAHPPPRGGGAEQKARDLLKQWLSSVQLAQYERTGHFEVTGCDSGKHYRIRRGRQMNVFELDQNGVQVAAWCFGPGGRLPVGDIMLAQKIALETDEHAALAVANRVSQ